MITLIILTKKNNNNNNDDNYIEIYHTMILRKYQNSLTT